MGIVFIFFVPNDKVLGRLIGLALPDYLFAIPIFFIIIKKLDFHRLNEYWGRALKFNVVLIPHYLSGVLLASSDRLMIANMIGNDKVAVYSMMYTCASIVGLFYSAASSALTPFYLQSIKEEKYDELNKKTISAIFVTVALSSMVMFIAPEILKFFAPSGYYEGISLIPILIFGLYLNFFYLLFSNFAFYYEKKYFITTATIVGALINIGLNYWLLPIYGYKAAAYTTVIGYLILAIANYILCRRLTGRKIFNMKAILSIMFGFLVVTVISMLLYSCFVARLCIALTVFVLIVIYRKKILVVFKKGV